MPMKLLEEAIRTASLIEGLVFVAVVLIWSLFSYLDGERAVEGAGSVRSLQSNTGSKELLAVERSYGDALLTVRLFPIYRGT